MDMIQSQIVDSDVSMDAVAIYRDNMIVIKPCPWDNDKAMELTPRETALFCRTDSHRGRRTDDHLPV